MFLDFSARVHAIHMCIPDKVMYKWMVTRVFLSFFHFFCIFPWSKPYTHMYMCTVYTPFGVQSLRVVYSGAVEMDNWVVENEFLLSVSRLDHDSLASGHSSKKGRIECCSCFTSIGGDPILLPNKQCCWLGFDITVASITGSNALTMVSCGDLVCK